MKQIELKQLVEKNERLCFIIGVMSAQFERPDIKMKEWINKAIENVVYNNEPLPEMPK